MIPLTRKPNSGTRLNFLHPYCPDHCWPLLSPQLVSASVVGGPPGLHKLGQLVTPSNVPVHTYVPGRKYGLSLRHSATTDITNLVEAADFPRVIPASGGHTFMFAYRKTDATLRASTAFGSQVNSGTSWYEALLPYSDANIYWRYGGTTEGTSQLTVASGGLTFGDDIWTFTTGPRGMEIWQNGILRGSNSGNATLDNTSSSPLLRFPAGHAGAASDLCDIGLIMSWRRQIPKSVIRELAVNPWQIFENYSNYQLRSGIATSPGTFNFPALTLAS